MVELYEIGSLDDLFRFEFVNMVKMMFFIKKCKNCGRFFIPKRRADAEYCERIFTDNGRKCSEIGATLRYEKKVAGNPILEAHKSIPTVQFTHPCKEDDAGRVYGVVGRSSREAGCVPCRRTAV